MLFMDTFVLWSFMIAFGISACCGFRAGLCLIFISALAHIGWLGLDPLFNFMSSQPFIVLACVMAAAEILLDKFRKSSYIADIFGLVLRTGAAVWISLAIMAYSRLGVWAVVGAVLGGLTSCIINMAKPIVGTWLVDLMPGSVSLGTVILSVFTDIVIVAGLIIGYWYKPFLAISGILSLIMAIFALVKFYRQGGRMSWFWGRVVSKEVEH